MLGRIHEGDIHDGLTRFLDKLSSRYNDVTILERLCYNRNECIRVSVPRMGWSHLSHDSSGSDGPGESDGVFRSRSLGGVSGSLSGSEGSGETT